ncbi:hypothetical protein M422DRAFT_258974 [Sphaerobolus stellatus SS14]|uniref:Uncharacterized protein n=1 Tax=Sphaerobolus stellatus (strain SS14) TaxID=990650 RepID=A0A0C9U5R5_SPHS4|nr:hypothetical protein M422DRAFT_258974 [Sphaerobolus stellatus SS14]
MPKKWKGDLARIQNLGGNVLKRQRAAEDEMQKEIHIKDVPEPLNIIHFDLDDSDASSYALSLASITSVSSSVESASESESESDDDVEIEKNAGILTFIGKMKANMDHYTKSLLQKSRPS